jgi:hypothetical protein
MVMPPDLIDRDFPVTIAKDGEEKVFEYILKLVNCSNSGNKDNFRQEYYRPPITVHKEKGGRQDYVIYRCGRATEALNPDFYSSKHTVVNSQTSWQVEERAAFGTVVLSGHGVFEVAGKEPVVVESASMYYDRNEIGADEVFVAAGAAKKLSIRCASYQKLSFYQHFASNSNPESTSLKIA